MTTIAAIQGEGWVVMGSDTQSTLDDYRAMKMGGQKIYEVNGFLIGGAGMGRGLDLMHKAWQPPKPPKTKKKPEELDQWMVYGFIPAMRELFMQSGYDMKDLGDFARHESAFIIAVRGIAYYLDSDYAIDREQRGIMTTGSGGDYAMGALHALGPKIFKSIENAQKAIETAIEAAKEYDVYSGGDTHIFVQQA